MYTEYNKHYERVNKKIPAWETAEQTPHKFACTNKPWLPENKNARILDFGCGQGHQLLSLWCAGYRNIEGVEISKEQADAAKRASSGRVQITCMDGTLFLSDKNQAYDLIILNDVLEHISKKDAVPLLILINKALVLGGKIVVHVPNMASLVAAFSYAADFTHIAGYTEFSLMQVLDQAGFCNHQFIPDKPEINFSLWRPWVPWRGVGLRNRVNRKLHQVIYWLSGKPTKPTIFSHNIEVYSQKPVSKGD